MGKSNKSNRQPSILEVAVHNAGYVRGPKVCVDLVAWAMAMARPEWAEATSMDERLDIFADVYATNRRNAYRRLNAFRVAFPDERDPFRLAGWLLDRYGWENLSADDVGLTLYPSP